MESRGAVTALRDGSVAEHALWRWLGFWFAVPPYALLALMRIGVGAMLLYTLVVRSFDLEVHLSAGAGWAEPGLLRQFDSMAWPFSVFGWVDGTVWLWSVHVLAIILATAFALGVLPTVTGLLSLLLQLSYAHRNPAVLVELDALLVLALFYLTIAPTGRRLALFAVRLPEPEPYGPHREVPRTFSGTWGQLPLRLLQIHLCVLYFQSGLGKLTADWLAGSALFHPRILQLGAPLDPQLLAAEPYLAPLIAYALALFELFYGVLIWLRPLRVVVLAVAVAVHLWVGVLWDMLAFNLTMVVLNLAFLPPRYAAAAVARAEQLWLALWAMAAGRT